MLRLPAAAVGMEAHHQRLLRPERNALQPVRTVIHGAAPGSVSRRLHGTESGDRVDREGNATRGMRRVMSRHGREDHGYMEFDTECRAGDPRDVARHASPGGRGWSVRFDAEVAREAGDEPGGADDGLFPVSVAVDRRAVHLHGDAFDMDVDPCVARAVRRGVSAGTSWQAARGSAVAVAEFSSGWQRP